jgi:hypothetical protein
MSESTTKDTGRISPIEERERLLLLVLGCASEGVDAEFYARLRRRELDRLTETTCDEDGDDG